MSRRYRRRREDDVDKREVKVEEEEEKREEVVEKGRYRYVKAVDEDGLETYRISPR